VAARGTALTGFLALTRGIPEAITRCELTHLERVPIDLARARAQHHAYEQRLAELGGEVRRLPADPDLADAVFIEDTAVVLDELAVIARPGAPSRRAEVAEVEQALRGERPLARIEPPGTLDGGDVLLVGRTLLVGRSSRTNDEGARQLRALLEPLGYRVDQVAVGGCLHLKSAVTAPSDDLLLLNPEWVDADGLPPGERVEVDRSEPFAGNVLRVFDTVLVDARAPRTRERLEQRGIRTVTVDQSELAKAEGGLTCCSLIVPRPAR
jgi:dimethylargininase